MPAITANPKTKVKKKTKKLKPIVRYSDDPDPKLQFEFKKDIEEDKKVKEHDVFEGKSKKKTRKHKKKK